MGNSIFPEVGGSGGTPGGTNTQVQFNDAGSFGGDSALTWVKGTNALAVGGTVAISSGGTTTQLSVTQADDSSWLFELINATSAVLDPVQGYITNGGDLAVSNGGGVRIDAADFAAGLIFTAAGAASLYATGLTLGAPTTVNDLLTTNQRIVNTHAATSAADARVFYSTTTNASGVAGYYDANLFANGYTATDRAASDTFSTLTASTTFGDGTHAAIGTAQNLNSILVVSGSGSADNEYVPHLNVLRVDLGTGYTQSAGPIGRGWLADWGVQGPIAVRPDALNGLVLVANNNYNGSPADSPSGGLWLTTLKGAGPGIDATHAAAHTYAMDVALGITGTSNAGSAAIGWTTAIQIGGTGSPWGEASSKIGTGLNIRDYATAGININNASATTAPSIIFDTFLQTSEMTAPSAPAANGVRIYAQDNGGGKTQLMALFNSGAAQQIAIQP